MVTIVEDIWWKQKTGCLWLKVASLSLPLSLSLSLSLSPSYRSSKSPMSVEGRHQYEELQLVTLLEVIRLRCPRCLSLSHTYTQRGT